MEALRWICCLLIPYAFKVAGKLLEITALSVLQVVLRKAQTTGARVYISYLIEQF